MARSLDQIPFKELRVGMKVVNAHGLKGEISGLHEKYPFVDVGMSPCISFKWEQGQDSLHVYHNWCNRLLEDV
jgi:hypothetical protein